MKFFRWILGFVLFLLLTAILASVVYAASSPTRWSEAVEQISGYRLAAMLAGVALLLIMLLYIVAGFSSKKPQEQYIAFDNEGGAVRISVKAIRDFVVRIGSEFAAVMEMDPTITALNGAMDVDLDVKIRSGTQIPELCRLIQDRIRDSVRENLGLADIRNVRINVRQIVATAQDKHSDPSGDWEGTVQQ